MTLQKFQTKMDWGRPNILGIYGVGWPKKLGPPSVT